MIGVIGIALAGALCIAAGWVIQQHAAAQRPPSERLSFRLLAHLVQRPLWLGGVLAMAGGQILGAIALDHGTLALVEPVMATNLLFALPLSAIWYRRRLGRREWFGAAMLVSGLAAFIAAGDPRGGSDTQLPWPNWVISGGAIVLLAAALVSIAKRRTADLQATMLASGAGLLYGLQDALTQRTEAGFPHGFFAAIISWPAFSLLAIAVVGMLLAQSAFEAAPLPASLPAMTVAEPITAIVFGAAVYGEHLRLGSTPLAVELVGFAVMVTGVFLVARSPLVTGNFGTEAPRLAPGEVERRIGRRQHEASPEGASPEGASSEDASSDDASSDDAVAG